MTRAAGMAQAVFRFCLSPHKERGDALPQNCDVAMMRIVGDAFEIS